MTCGRPELCEYDDEPHTLDWLTDDFAYCAGCDLLYTRQPGVLVWIYDPWACRLAEALMRARAQATAAELGLPKDFASALPDDLRETE